VNGPRRRPVEFLLGDLHVAELRLAWARSRARRAGGDHGAADLAGHVAATADARRLLAEEEQRLHVLGDAAGDVERQRAMVTARFKVQAERAREACGCWRCEDTRSLAQEQPPAADAVRFKVLLGASHLEVDVRADGAFLGAVDLDSRRRFEPAELRAFAGRLGRLRALDEVARFQVRRAGGGRG